MAWTSEQIKAIEEEGTNIIVSAGAGSGKTAVLTTRVLEKVKKAVCVLSCLPLRDFTWKNGKRQSNAEKMEQNCCS